MLSASFVIFDFVFPEHLNQALTSAREVFVGTVGPAYPRRCQGTRRAVSVRRLSRLRQTDCVDDLYLPPSPGAPRGLRVPAGELVELFSRASGPGGQGVNTTDSRVQLGLDLGTTTALNDVQRERALGRLAASISGTTLTISASEHRSQRGNRKAARQRLTTLLREAVAPPVIRRSTRPTRGSLHRRLEGKRRRSEIKGNRTRPGPE